MSFMPHPFPPPPPVAPSRPTIKLALEGPGAEKDGPFVRVQLTDEIGPQSLEMLRGRALDLWKMDNSTTDRNMDDAKVFFTYRDVENDLCFIFSDEDLRCALPLFPSSLRVFARVEFPKKTEPVAQESSNKSTSTQTGSPRSISDIPVHKVVESVVGVLTAASVALQKHVKVSSTSSVRSSTTSTQPTSSTTTAEPPAAAAAAPNATCTPVEAAEERPFIHGRHTCDGCLTTPIVGKRFHAANLPDYDLCATCKDNYKGDEITFEEAELDRDRPMQERWNRRFNKWAKKQDKQQERWAKKQARRNGPAASAPPATAPHGPPFCPPHAASMGPGGPPFGPGGPPFGPPHCRNGQRGRRGHGGARHWNLGPPPDQCGPPPEQVDQALKEAIRRSMLDLQQNNKKDNVEEKQKDEVNTVFAAPTEEAAPAEEKKEPAEEKKDVPVADLAALYVSAPSETVEEEFEIPPAPVGAHPAPRPAEPAKAEEPVVGEAEEDAKPAPVEDEAKVAAAEESAEVGSEESFSEDAEGNGVVAAALGETMDMLAHAINDIASELERHSPNDDAASEKSGVVVDDAAQKEGATILAGEEETNEDDESQNSWDVVSKDQQVSNDEALARAANIIGSALFESAVSASGSSNPSANNMIGSDHSIPTTLPSVGSIGSVQAPQMERWALQLRQLHELGFIDDQKSIDIMERLQAANIGSGETAEVSVERVVDEIMKGW